MVYDSLNGKADPEGSFAEDIVDVGYLPLPLKEGEELPVRL